MTIHREGYKTILLTLVFIAVIDFLTYYFLCDFAIVKGFIFFLSLMLLLIVLQFFRNPSRVFLVDDKSIIAPADGKVVVIEEVEEPEYFKDKRLQISVFMSPLNVHINRYPIGGIVKYVKYHPGKYLVAWHPKSSTENERSTVVVENEKKQAVLFRQIAGALAKRIVYYAKEQDVAKQTTEFGFIKFGSRVDLYLPLGSKVKVGLNQKVKGGQTVIAEF